MMRKQIITLLGLCGWVSLYAQHADSLRMDSVMHALPEVMIKGSKPVVRMQGGKLTYDIRQMLSQRQADNAYEALLLLPGVNEKEEKLSMGNQPVNIVIDGHTTTMPLEQISEHLKTIPAKNIERVEVMYSAPAKYHLRGIVINVVLRHHNEDNSPLTGELHGNWAQSHDAKFNERLSMLYNRGKWSVDLVGELKQGRLYDVTEQWAHHEMNDGIIHDVYSRQARGLQRSGYFLRLGTDWNIADNHQLSLVYTGSRTRHDVSQAISGNIEGRTDVNTRDILHNVMLDYQMPFGFKAGAEMLWYDSPSTEHVKSLMPTGKVDYRVENGQRINMWKFSLDEEMDLNKKLSLNYGGIYTFSLNHNRQQFDDVKHLAQGMSDLKNKGQNVRIREDRVNFYAGIDSRVNDKLSFSGSLSAEYYRTPAWHQWMWYPTFSLSWRPAPGHALMFSFNSDRQYPSYETMTSYISYGTGGYTEITGNPSLRPSTDMVARLIYVYKSKYQLIAWFEHDDRYFQQTAYQRHDRLAMSYQYLNFNFEREAGLMASVPVTVGKWLHTNITLMGIWTRDKNSHFYDIPFDRHVFAVMGQINNTITVSRKPDIVATVDGNVRTKGIQATYDLPASGALNVGVRWRFAHRQATLKVYANDVLETSKINPIVLYHGQDFRMHFTPYREFGVSFAYKWGKYEKKEREEVDLSRMK